MNRETISKCVKMAMIRKGIDSPGLAEALKVTEATIANYRAGKVADLGKLSNCAEACGMTFAEMMKLAD